MPTATWIALANYTVSGSTDGLVEFTNIPTTGYSDLVLVMEYNPTTTESAYIQLNGDTGTNYFRTLMYGSGSGSGTVVANASVNRMRPGTGIPNARHVLIAQFLDSNATNKHKTVLTRFDDASNETAAGVFRWANTNAITSITIGQDASGAFNVGSAFSLYGIAS
jgi:hypothetical protein